MLLSTWNCQAGLKSNWDVVEALGADVLTIQECGPKTQEQAVARGGWTCEWQPGRYEKKGLAVLARSPFEIEAVESQDRCFIVSTIVGPEGLRFRFVGFWGMTPSEGGTDSYPQQATELISRLPEDGLPTVVAGDFNASSRNEHHLRNVAELERRGMVNAYNSFHGLDAAAQPPDPTSFFQWNKERPYHMDFVFVPTDWKIERVKLDSLDDFPDRRLSDHVPVLVSVATGA